MRLVEPTGVDAATTAERAYLFRMRDEAHYSRDNTPQELMLTAEGRSEVQYSIARFASSRAMRLFLVLELADGQAIVMYNSLRADVPADNEPGAKDDLFSPPADAWELKVEIWPLGVCQNCYCQKVEVEADNSPKLCRECAEEELNARR